MKIDSLKITIRELTAGYCDDDEAGVRGYGGKLDIRPPYQREFIYDLRLWTVSNAPSPFASMWQGSLPTISCISTISLR